MPAGHRAGVRFRSNLEYQVADTLHVINWIITCWRSDVHQAQLAAVDHRLADGAWPKADRAIRWKQP